MVLPIVDLEGRLIGEDELEVIEARFGSYLQAMEHERYIGRSAAGLHGDRTPQTRAREHERAGLTHPYRRLPLAITRVNQENGPVQMHVLLAGAHPDQIAWIESRLIRLFGGTGPMGWNSTPGHTEEPDSSSSKKKRDDEDDDFERMLKPRGFLGGLFGTNQKSM
jgi:hypothetical protein